MNCSQVLGLMQFGFSIGDNYTFLFIEFVNVAYPPFP